MNFSKEPSQSNGETKSEYEKRKKKQEKESIPMFSEGTNRNIKSKLTTVRINYDEKKNS